MPVVLKSGSFNLLEPSGPVQACNGIALPFILDILKLSLISYEELQCSVDVYCVVMLCAARNIELPTLYTLCIRPDG